MNDHEKLRLRDPEVTPTSELLEQGYAKGYSPKNDNKKPLERDV